MSVVLKPKGKPLYEIYRGMGSIATTSAAAPYEFDSCNVCGCMVYEAIEPDRVKLRGHGRLSAAVTAAR